MLPVGATLIVVGAVALCETGFAEFEEVESVGLVFGPGGIIEFDGRFAVAHQDLVLFFNVDVEHTPEVVVVAAAAADFDRFFVNGVVVDAEGQLDFAHFGDRLVLVMASGISLKARSISSRDLR